MNRPEYKVYHPSKGILPVYGFNEKFVFTNDFNSPEHLENIFPIEDSVLLEKTPFPDTDGNPIYEGDQLIDLDVELEEGTKLEDTKQQVYWCDKKGAWMLDNSFKQDKGSGEFLHKELRDFRFKVVGNIYESNNN